MQKNVASQKIQLFAFDITTGAPVTGDAANLTAYVSKDHGTVTVLGDTSATQMDATNAPGVYVFDLTQAETNADELTFTAKSSTANVSITPRFISTTPPAFTSQVAQTGDSFARLGAPAGASTAADVAAIKAVLPAALVSGRMDASVGAMAANVMTAAAAASDLTTELQSGLATAASIVALNNLSAAQVNAEVDAAIADAALATAASIAALNNLSAAQVNAEVDTAIADAALATQASVDDLPTNAELATALAAADDAVLAQVALVKAKTDNLPPDPADASDIAAALGAIEGEFAALATQASVDDLPTNAELATALAAADDAVLTAIGALSIPTAAAIADAVHDEVVEGTTTLRQSVRLANAALGGKASGLDTTTATYRDLADTKNRITATVDADGNRTAVSRDLS